MTLRQKYLFLLIALFQWFLHPSCGCFNTLSKPSSPKLAREGPRQDYGCGYFGTGVIIQFLGGHYMWKLEKQRYTPKYQKFWEGGLRWLSYVAIPQERGYKWALSQKQSGIPIIENIIISNLFLRGYQATQDAAYFDFYDKSKKWVISKAVSDYPGSYAWPYMENATFGFVAVTEFGLSGIGAFFLSLYKHTGDEAAKKYAQGVAEWLKAIAIPVPLGGQPGYKWKATYGEVSGWPGHAGSKCFTGWCWGAAGVCWFLYKMYQEFGDETYRLYADGGLNWLKSIAVPEAGGYKWPQYEGKNEYHITWGQGAASIGNIFLLGYQLTGEVSYLEYAQGAARWIISQAVATDGGGYKWVDIQPDKLYFATDWCRGSVPISLFFANLYAETGNELYKKYALGAYKWLNSIKVVDPISGGYTWFISDKESNIAEPPYLAGTASMLRYISKKCRERALEEFADKAALWLIEQRVKEQGGYKWPQRVNISSLNKVKFNMRQMSLQGYPNPFNNSSRLVVSPLPGVKIRIYNLLGQLVREIPNFTSWDGRDNLARAVSPGVYFYELQIDNKSIIKQNLFLK
jgi:rhamnogalacturonyl hydrolase YesR